MEEDRKNPIGRAVERTVNRVGTATAQSQVVSATKERASAVGSKARAATVGQLQLATREDVDRLQQTLDRLEVKLNDLAERLPAKSAKARPRRTKADEEKAADAS
jgi:ubiquinone biosynthesis protein UbiJ